MSGRGAVDRDGSTSDPLHFVLIGGAKGRKSGQLTSYLFVEIDVVTNGPSTLSATSSIV